MRRISGPVDSTDTFLTTAVLIFAFTTFSIALGHFYTAIGAAGVAGIMLSLLLSVVMMRRTSKNAITIFLFALDGVVAGILGALLFFVVTSLFIE